MAFQGSRQSGQGWPPRGDWEDLRAQLPELPRISPRRWGLLGIAALLLWAATGIYIIGPGEQGVVLQFGRVVKTSGPGLNYRLPWPVQEARVVNVEAIQRLEVGFRTAARQPGTIQPVPAESHMLTGDENIVDAQLIVQYRIGDPIRYLFHLRDPVQTLRAATEVALRSRVGNMTIDDVLTTGRATVQDEAREFLQQLMNNYESGILVTDVKLQTVDAPEQVKDAFHEVVRAREDRERMINQARGYHEDVIPKARGEAQEVLRAAEAYQEERVLKARGDAARFGAILAEYRKAPAVTRERLHLETVEKILTKSDKVILDSKSGTLPFLPLKGFNDFERSMKKQEAKGGQP
jgi:membrane protease subunit HflK